MIWYGVLGKVRYDIVTYVKVSKVRYGNVWLDKV